MAKEEKSSYTRGLYHVTGGRSPKRFLKVTFPDGTVIQEFAIRDTYIKTIEKIGPAKAAEYFGTFSRYYGPVMSKNPEDYVNCTKQREIAVLSDGWRLLTVGGAECIKDYLKEASEKLNLGLEVEVIQPEQNN